MLSSNLESQLYTCVTDILKLLMGGVYSNHGLKNRHGHATQLRRASAAIKAVVDDAIADFHEEWNAAQPDPLYSLPRELTSSCFGHLGFADRITASHVSRSWRSMTLSDCALWTQLTMTIGEPAIAADAVASMFQRSGHRPFSLRLTLLDGPRNALYRIFDAILQNISHIKCLELDCVLLPNMLPRLFEHDVPMLETLSFDLSVVRPRDPICELPSNWGSRRAPRLRSLAVGRFSVPVQFEPIVTLRSFSGEIPLGDGGFTRRLFSLLPNLEHLELQAVTEQSLEDILHMPPSTTRVRLNSCGYESQVDYSVFQRGISRRAWRHIYLGWPVDLSGWIEFAAQATIGAWSLDITSDDDTLIKIGLDSDRSCEFQVPDGAFNLLFLASDSVARLSELSLSPRMLTKFALASWDHELPCLRLLNVRLISEDDYVSPATLSPAEHMQPIRAPRLEMVTLDTTNIELVLTGWLEHSAADLLHRLCTWSWSRVTLVMSKPSWLLDGADPARLRAFALQLQIIDRSSGEKFVFVNDGGIDPS